MRVRTALGHTGCTKMYEVLRRRDLSLPPRGRVFKCSTLDQGLRFVHFVIACSTLIQRFMITV